MSYILNSHQHLPLFDFEYTFYSSPIDLSLSQHKLQLSAKTLSRSHNYPTVNSAKLFGEVTLTLSELLNGNSFTIDCTWSIISL